MTAMVWMKQVKKCGGNTRVVADGAVERGRMRDIPVVSLGSGEGSPSASQLESRHVIGQLSVAISATDNLKLKHKRSTRLI